MKNMLRLLVAVFFVFVNMISVLAESAVIWKSQPVNPGEAVMVFGGPWSTNSVVELSGKANVKVAPICITDDCISFVYPEDWPLSDRSYSPHREYLWF